MSMGMLQEHLSLHKRRPNLKPHLEIRLDRHLGDDGYDDKATNTHSLLTTISNLSECLEDKEQVMLSCMPLQPHFFFAAGGWLGLGFSDQKDVPKV